ncbi:MAG: hypothetical protein FWD66_08965 [Paludibacter sp.]|nr:hypothetical protein [Paludibacter sp.]
MFNNKKKSESADNNDVIAIASTLNAMKNDTNIAAIAATLLLYFSEPHDVENTVLTIRRNPQWRTPWNTKLLNFNNLHR